MKTALVIAAVLAASPVLAAEAPTVGPEAGAAFLARNAHVPGVHALPSGLQYRIVSSGPSAGVHPGATEVVTFHYEGRLLTGEVFDSSLDGEPLSGAVNRFVPGFTEALKLMRPGDEWIVFIPPALGYRDRSVGSIPPNSVLQFRLKLLSIGTPATPAG